MKLAQFQEIYRINKSDIPEEDKMTEMVACLSGKTVSQVEDMLLPDFNKLALEVKESLTKPIKECDPSKEIKGYGVTYEPAKINRGQYVTVNHFMKDPIENAHLILASITYNPKTGKHEAENHAQIAEDLQDADMEEVLPACVFFCRLFEDSIKSLRSYLAKATMSKIKSRTEIGNLIRLMKDLDGYTMLNRSQTLRA